MVQRAHVPTPESRTIARSLSGYGIPQEQIAAEIGVSLPTLHKHYREDLDAGIRKANAMVVQSLHKKATGDGPQAVTAAIWWTKTRMGWRGESVEVTGKDGGPLEINEAGSARARIAARIERLAAALPAATARDIEETEEAG